MTLWNLTGTNPVALPSDSLIRSILLYPIIETTHVLTLCLFLGMISMWDLRLLGLVMKKVPVTHMAERIMPWGLAGFVIMVLSGLALFCSTPVRASQNPFFQVKMDGLKVPHPTVKAPVGHFRVGVVSF